MAAKQLGSVKVVTYKRQQPTMGNATMLILSYFVLYLSYNSIMAGAKGLDDTDMKNPLRSNSLIRVAKRQKQLYLMMPNYQRDKAASATNNQEMEFIDDSDFENSKRAMDDYGHLRFGKRGTLQDWQEDYGHLRFGR